MSENGLYTDIKQIINILSAKGGIYWEKGNFRRVYFNENSIMEIMKIKAEFYNTGNLNRISVNGEGWSNHQGNMLLSTIRNDKFWYDFSTRDFRTKGDGEYANLVLDTLRAECASVIIPKKKHVRGCVHEWEFTNRLDTVSSDCYCEICGQWQSEIGTWTKGKWVEN